MRLALLQGEELIVNEDEPAVPAHVQHPKPPPAETPGAPGEAGLTDPFSCHRQLGQLCAVQHCIHQLLRGANDQSQSATCSWSSLSGCMGHNHTT